MFKFSFIVFSVVLYLYGSEWMGWFNFLNFNVYVKNIF